MSEEAKRHGASTPAVVRARKAIRAIVPLAIIVAINRSLPKPPGG